MIENRNSCVHSFQMSSASFFEQLTGSVSLSMLAIASTSILALLLVYNIVCRLFYTSTTAAVIVPKQQAPKSKKNKRATTKKQQVDPKAAAKGKKNALAASSATSSSSSQSEESEDEKANLVQPSKKVVCFSYRCVRSEASLWSS